MGAAKGHLNVCNTLLAAGARVNALGKDAFTPLHVAQNGHCEVCAALVAAGAPVAASSQRMG